MIKKFKTKIKMNKQKCTPSLKKLLNTKNNTIYKFLNNKLFRPTTPINNNHSIRIINLDLSFVISFILQSYIHNKIFSI